MASIVKILRVAADPNRLRILMLLRADELSVAELQEILAMGQSTISTHLAQLKQAGLVEDRRTGKSNLYRLATTHRFEGFTLSIPPRDGPDAAAEPGPPEGENIDGHGPFQADPVPPEGEIENSPGQAQRSPGNTANQTDAP